MTRSARSRVALVVSEPLRARMAGIGIRYVEMARQLAGSGKDVLLVSPPTADGAGLSRIDPGDCKEGRAPGRLQLEPFERGRLGEMLQGYDAVVAQGQLANDVVLEVPHLPTVIDLYDPWLVENLHYTKSLGLDPWRNDHATWILQMSRGDFFLCSSQEQRLFYLGWLAALGRVNPDRVSADPDLRGLIDVVPFGVPDVLPAHRAWLPERRSSSEKRLLFGGLYDWYDPMTVLDALEALNRAQVSLYFVRNPNPGSTPQRRLQEVEARCKSQPALAQQVEILDWIPFERRYDLLRDVDAVVAAHHPSLETELSLRTRFLDALVAERPIVVTEGGTLGRWLRDHDAGWTAPAGDSSAMARALLEVLDGGAEVRERVARGQTLLEPLSWRKVLSPLTRFLDAPRCDATKAEYVQGLETRSPQDPFGFRLRRFLRRTFGAPSGGAAT